MMPHRVPVLPFAALSGLLAAMTPAAAQETYLYGGGAVELFMNKDGEDGGSVEIEGYLEYEVSGFYAGIWGQLADDDTLNEIDLYLGYRGETGQGLSYDVGYARYYYPEDGGDCCGEVTLGLGFPLGDTAAATLDLAYDPEAKIGNAYVGAEYYATDRLTLSANYGVYEVEDAGDEQEWDLGGTLALGEETGLDLRYYDGSDYDAYLGLTLTWDTTIFSR